MVDEAESYAAADKEKKLIIEAKNDADSILYSSEKTLNEYKDKIGKEDAEAVETAIKELREAVEAEDLEQIKEKTNAVQGATMKIGEAIYKDGDNQGETVDADFKKE